MAKPKATDRNYNKKYDELIPKAHRLKVRLLEQVETIVEENQISLAVPIEARVKSYSSVIDKIERKSITDFSFSQIEDFVGIRIIVLFQRDADTIHEIISEVFDVVEFDDTSKRLEHNQFGYQSNHYVVKIPKDWTKIPSFKGLEELTAEIQVRTVAQHIWAAASHKLQYKREDSVPVRLRRSIHRISALLETVDLELSRLIEHRLQYVDSLEALDVKDGALNVDILQKILEDSWPSENALIGESYDKLQRELEALSVKNGSMLVDIINKHKPATMRHELEYINDSSNYEHVDMDRFERGVYFTHLGLTRHALGLEFGESTVRKVITGN